MSVRFDGSTDDLRRTASLPVNTAVTMCGWGAIRGTGGSSARFLWNLTDGVAFSSSIVQSVAGNDIAVQSTAGSANMITPATDEWFFAAFTQNGTGANALKGYAALATSASLSTAQVTGDTYTPSIMSLAFATAGVYWWNGALAAIKVWDAVLTQAELDQERWFYRPQRIANLHLWSPFVEPDTTNFRDYSGAGKDWTEAGTVTNESGPPIAWGAPAKRRWYALGAAGAAGWGHLMDFQRNRLAA